MDLSSLPSISQLLQSSVLKELPHALAKRVATHVVSQRRQILLNGGDPKASIHDSVQTTLHLFQQPKLRPVINATGIIVHTNLGRAPLAKEAVERIRLIAGGYSNLELHLDDGRRGGRLKGVADRICRITGAEEAIVVNNNAAAVLLAVTAIAKGKDVLVSRGELVEIGGSFRVPDVIESGGASLVEVGTTNRTRAIDFKRASCDSTGAFLRVHPSNFQICGFTERPDRRELAAIANTLGICLIEDLGSGLLSHGPEIPQKKTLEAEESVRRAIEEGVDLVTFSGDKLLAGPQAGFIAGKASYVQACRKHPLYRALRICKLSLAALESTLAMHEDGKSNELPIWKMFEKTAASCLEDATRIATGIRGASVISGESYSGGGALPNQALDTHLVVFSVPKPNAFLDHLRGSEPAIMLRIQQDKVCIDPRTLLPGDESILIEKINLALSDWP